MDNSEGIQQGKEDLSTKKLAPYSNATKLGTARIRPQLNPSI